MAPEDEQAAILEAANKATFAPFDGIIEVRCKNSAHIWIDGRGEPVALAECPDGEINCVWRGGRETILRIFSNERAIDRAYIAGRLQIEGDMSVMTRLRINQPT